MIKKYFFIFLSFFILLSIIPANASGSEWISIQPTSDNWVIIYNNNIYLYNGTLDNITPKYIVYLNKTYSNYGINERYGYLYYIDSLCLGNETYIVCNAWDGCHIGKLDINNRTLYLDSRVLGQYYTLKCNNKEALACFDNKEGMGAEPILIELKYNNSLAWIGDNFYGLNLELENYLSNYLNESPNYKIDDFTFFPFSFDYNLKNRYWLIYVKGIYFIPKENESEEYRNISDFIKYNGTFYDFREFKLNDSKLYYLYAPYINRITYDKYNNQWIILNGKGNSDLLSALKGGVSLGEQRV